MKVKCEIILPDDLIILVFAAVTIICIGTAWWPYRYVSVDLCIDSDCIVRAIVRLFKLSHEAALVSYGLAPEAAIGIAAAVNANVININSQNNRKSRLFTTSIQVAGEDVSLFKIAILFLPLQHDLHLRHIDNLYVNL